MFKKLSCAALVIITSFGSLAGDINNQISSEYGNCYKDFTKNLHDCTPSTCTYPDLTDAKSWKAHTINGEVNGGCYVMYYSYIGQQITSSPYYCLYDNKQKFALADLYSQLFRTDSAEDVLSLKEKINLLALATCKQQAPAQSSAATAAPTQQAQSTVAPAQ